MNIETNWTGSAGRYSLHDRRNIGAVNLMINTIIMVWEIFGEGYLWLDMGWFGTWVTGMFKVHQYFLTRRLPGALCFR